MHGQIGKGLDYVKSISFVLKIVEFIILLIALCTVGIFLDKADFKLQYPNTFSLYGKKGGLEFSMFVIVVSWLVVIGFATIFLTGLHEKISVLNWPLTVIINFAIWALLLFIAACVVSDTVRRYDHDTRRVRIKYHSTLRATTFCEVLDLVNSDAKCGHLIGGAVCCFFASIVLAVDVFVHFRIYRSAASPSAPPAATIT